MNIYTGEQWAKDRSFKAEAGQEITAEIYEHFYNVMPIQRLKEAHGCIAGFRTTEPYTHDFKTGKPLYMAFGKKDGKYYYLGLQ